MSSREDPQDRFTLKYSEELVSAARTAFEDLKAIVAGVMRANGENPEDAALLALRARQAAYSLDSLSATEQRAAEELARQERTRRLVP